MHKKYIITGAPGTGKTSLINELNERGYLCYEEISRKIIKGQQKVNGNKTPWGDVSGFVDLVYTQTIKELIIMNPSFFWHLPGKKFTQMIRNVLSLFKKLSIFISIL